MNLRHELLDDRALPSAKEPESAIAGRSSKGYSTAYYALFHRLVGDGASRLADQVDQQDVLARSFIHTEMKKSCQLLLKSPIPPFATRLVGGAVSHELRNVASTFILLQELRHDADYDRGRRFDKSEARDAIGRVEAAFRDWELVSITPIAQVYLGLLLLGDRWHR